jgi:hypothetical protein
MRAPLKMNGKQFGRLTVVRLATQRNKDGKRLWHCRCQCGGKTILTSHDLISGNTTSCGCKRPTPKVSDFIGTVHGKLTVLGISDDRTKGGKRLWRCKCDCGGERLAPTDELMKGRAHSCGCDRRNRTEDLTGRRFGKLLVVEPAETRHGRRRWKCLCQCGRFSTVATSNLKGQTRACFSCSRVAIYRTNRSRRKLYQDRETVTVEGIIWHALRKFCRIVGCSADTARRWRVKCKWLGKGVGIKMLEDGNGEDSCFYSDQDAQGILVAKLKGEPAVEAPEASSDRLSPQETRKRGRPKGRTAKRERREREMLERWDRGEYGTNKAKAGRAHGFHRQDATTIILNHERAERRKKSSA